MPASTAAVQRSPLHCVLRDKRVARRVTQRALATEMGVSYAYLNHLESGYRAFNPTLERRYRQALAIFK